MKIQHYSENKNIVHRNSERAVYTTRESANNNRRANLTGTDNTNWDDQTLNVLKKLNGKVFT